MEGYRKLSVNNQLQLLQYVEMTPVAVGICGTDKSFMFCKSTVTYSNICQYGLFTVSRIIYSIKS